MDVHRLDRTAQFDSRQSRIHCCQQCLPLCEPLTAHVFLRLQFTHTEVFVARVFCDEKRIVRTAEKSRVLAGRLRRSVVQHEGKLHAGWQVGRRRPVLGDDRAEIGIVVLLRVRLAGNRFGLADFAPHQRAVHRRVVAQHLVVHRPHDAQLLHVPGDVRQMFADRHSDNRRRNRRKLSPDIHRLPRLHVERVDMTHAAGLKQHQTRFDSRCANFRRCPRGVKLSQPGQRQRDTADAEHVPPGETPSGS